MRALVLLAVLLGSAAGPRVVAAEKSSRRADDAGGFGFNPWQLMSTVINMDGVNMQIMENSSFRGESPFAKQRLLSSSQGDDSEKVPLDKLADMIADIIAKEMKNAGVNGDDLDQFIANNTSQDSGDEQFPKDDDKTEDDNAKTTGDDQGSAGPNDKFSGLMQLSAPSPSDGDPSIPQGGGPDVFGNGTDYFTWLEDVLKKLHDKLAEDGSVADDTALNERPGQMDGKPTGDHVLRASKPGPGAIAKFASFIRDFRYQNSTIIGGQPQPPQVVPKAFSHLLGAPMDKADASTKAPAPSPGAIANFASYIRDFRYQNSTLIGGQPQPPKLVHKALTHLLGAPMDKADPSTKAHDDWKDSEDKHGGFDNIPKAVPMIVMSGNTYINDVGTFRNTYQYGKLPVRVRTIEPNGNDSGLELDDSSGNKKLQSSKHDGDTRGQRRIMRLSAQDLHGKDDGNTYNGEVHGHDDGNTYNGEVHGHDDGNTYNGEVHGHDDGNTYNGEVHGHDDGNTYNGEVHGHDDGNTYNGGHDDGGTSGSGIVHGHDDGNTYAGDMHGHNNGGGSRAILKSIWDIFHGHDDGETNNSPVHGHDDGQTNNSPVHGHDDSSSAQDDGETNNSPVHGHDDGQTNNSPVHGHGDSSSVHGHDDGETNKSAVHGHGDGQTYNRPVHGHDDGGRMRASADVSGAGGGRSNSLTMMGVTLIVMGTAAVILVIMGVVTAHKMRIGKFRRQDYIVV
ncbi:uncharacterized protein LOC122380698 isoform X1 [Amphibalanus amphitrite]|uniref:uncharacterized protein LOC122380698 isoform X1 n=1 Tax=Amphibalanus amphitrite TaxID=1232801 RepID=UPI001C8FF3DB|nr:uncharacterized protein LOC122380698 isoform X1 [Amphibalanus amphitrite]